MKFQPKTDQQIATENCLTPGQYDFEVIAATDKKSQKGNDMIELKLKVYPNDDSGARTIFDYLLEQMAFKLRHFAYAVGLGETYERGELTAAMCSGHSGKVALRIGQDKEKKYPPKNEVVDYVVPGEENEITQALNGQFAGAAARVESGDALDDDIPF